jgi:hypothetical protein
MAALTSLCRVFVAIVCCFRWSHRLLAAAMMSSSSSGDFDIEFYVLEEQPAPSFVGSVADFDVGPSDQHKSIRFRFLTSSATDRRSVASAAADASAMFSIDETNGDITTLQPIDRDRFCPRARVCVVRLDVVIHHQSSLSSLSLPSSSSPSSQVPPGGSRLDIVRVGIHVVDLNDNTPSFPFPIVARSIAESAGVGSSGFLVPGAEDADGPPYGVRQYFIVSDSGLTVPFNVSVVGSAGGGVPADAVGYQLRVTPTEQLDRETIDR